MKNEKISITVLSRSEVDAVNGGITPQLRATIALSVTVGMVSILGALEGPVVAGGVVVAGVAAGLMSLLGAVATVPTAIIAGSSATVTYTTFSLYNHFFRKKKA